MNGIFLLGEMKKVKSGGNGKPTKKKEESTKKE